ncbi:DUF2796 domain-containing protein [Limnobacter parvus]|uniref:DUF2796 domain-containing protein n=1 Tax=Limnobacter parvus TaxID=2939690 RepID=A0ABT1XEU8_9BURK|nr:DUF2796 domain-containing protein [Limnobacter parvus]MCR2745426.1 DUF2796 domain-containing protein [Limnobacter parvus]
MTNFTVRSWVTKLVAIATIATFSVSASAHGNDGHAHEHSESKGRHSDAAHVHGAGELEVVQDGKGLFISLNTPLYNVLGFEHMPKTDAERVKARRVTSLLKANGLFLFSNAAQCKRTAHKIYSEVLNPHSHGPQDDHQHHDSESGHSDLRVAYEFECEKPAALKQIEVRLFRQFPAFEKIEVQALFPSGQIGASLTPKQNILVIQ